MTAVTVVVPTFNEAGNIERLVGAVRATGAAVLVVDDGSPDGTGAIADRIAASDGGVSVLHRDEKSGLGAAYAAGFARALSDGASVICQMDADLSHDPGDLSRLVKAITEGGADLAIGSRYVPEGETVGWAFHRRLLSRGGNRYAAWMLRIPVRDATAGFRAWKADSLRIVDPASCASTGYGFQVEMVWRATRRGLTVVELPVVFKERQHGTSKMSMAIAIEAMVRVTRWGIANRFLRRDRGPERPG